MRHSLDFFIYEDGDPNAIIFIDKSKYFESPGNPIIEITYPNRNEVFSIVGNPTQIKVICSGQLCNQDCDISFPDGMYYIRYSVIPNVTLFSDKYYLRTVNITNRIKDILRKIDDLDIEESFINNLYKIDLLLVAARANEYNSKKAIEFYNQANKLLKKLECHV